MNTLDCSILGNILTELSQKCNSESSLDMLGTEHNGSGYSGFHRVLPTTERHASNLCKR